MSSFYISSTCPSACHLFPPWDLPRDSFCLYISTLEMYPCSLIFVSCHEKKTMQRQILTSDCTSLFLKLGRTRWSVTRALSMEPPGAFVSLAFAMWGNVAGITGTHICKCTARGCFWIGMKFWTQNWGETSVESPSAAHPGTLPETPWGSASTYSLPTSIRLGVHWGSLGQF